MKKQTKVLVAATLLTLGASFSSLAALKNGTWVPSEEGWQYADKEGEFVESEWAMSNGVQFWINDEGYLGANEWVSDDEYTYYVQSDGSMAVNAWKYIYGEDDEDADEESWFYFDAKGRMIKSAKKDINGATYYFDAEGKMLTGWVDKAAFDNADANTTVANAIFANENGAVVKSAWINEFPWTEDADDMYEGEDEEWYYAKSNGALATGKQSSIGGLTYFFNKDTGIMLEGWVVKVGDVYTASNGATFAEQGATEVYFATEDMGYAKKNGWRELEDPTEDDDFWYYFDKLGRAFLGTATDANVQAVTFADGEDNAFDVDAAVVTTEIKKIDGVKYYFNANGEMIDGLVEVDGNLMYLEGGAAVTGKVTLTDENENDYTFYFAEKTKDGQTKYVAAEGNCNGYCYKNGQLMTAEEGEYKIVATAHGSFVVDYRGKIQHNEKKEYEGIGTLVFDEVATGAAEDRIAE
jgi:glucan-binding YG repeat protein